MTGIASSQSFRQADEGPEKKCGRCKDWWPADTEFFNAAAGKPGGLSSWCKACCTEDRNATRAQARAERRGQAAEQQGHVSCA